MVIAPPVASNSKWDQERVSRNKTMDLPRFVGEANRPLKHMPPIVTR